MVENSTSENIEAQVWNALKGVRFPGTSRDVVSFGFVRQVAVDGGRVAVTMKITTSDTEKIGQVQADAQAAVAALEGVDDAQVLVDQQEPPNRAAQAQRAVSESGASLIPEVRHVIAVASGKGGVGKSTVAANLAVSLAAQGHAVGLLDADIYGPSQPMMFGITDKPRVEANRVIPFERHGVKIMSLGFLVETDTPVIWRGPMVMKALEQLLGDVEWGALDFLIIDLPPGTGDAQLTITQRVPLAGAVIVTTPQDVALIDARKGLAMFRKVNVAVLGIVENMSFFVCPHCGDTTHIFKHGGGERTADLLDTAFLGAVPLDAEVVQGGDSGVPIVVARPNGPHAEIFARIAEAVARDAERLAEERPQLHIS